MTDEELMENGKKIAQSTRSLAQLVKTVPTGGSNRFLNNMFGRMIVIIFFKNISHYA